MLKFYVSATQEKIPPSTVFYMRRTGEYGAGNHALMETFKKWVNENDLCHEDTVIYATPMDDPEKVEPCRCRYDVCIHRPPDQESVPGPVRCRELEVEIIWFSKSPIRQTRYKPHGRCFFPNGRNWGICRMRTGPSWSAIRKG